MITIIIIPGLIKTSSQPQTTVKRNPKKYNPATPKRQRKPFSLAFDRSISRWRKDRSFLGWKTTAIQECQAYQSKPQQVKPGRFPTKLGLF